MMRIGLFLLTNIAVLIVASITLSLLGVDHYVSGAGLNMTNLLIFCAVFGFTGSIISLFLSKKMAKMSTGTEIITQARNADEQWLLDTVAELSDKAGIKMPEVGIFPAQQANAFATGWNKNDALVAVSIGLLQRFQKEEIKAVMAHEIGHVANGDMVTLTLVQGVVNTFVMFAVRVVVFFIDQFTRNEEGEGGLGFIAQMALTVILDIVFGILASGIVAWFSRYREFRADEAGAKLANKHAMIGALQRLRQETEEANTLQGQMTAFGISGGKMSAFFASHPPLETRIAALQNIK
ncbi:MAG: protease HtpX [Neptuniibacter caesariensis]|uniref:Protease HtpX n=1 Tax=Neptuniibacter caesariensis TaxID=207954 RepID=A0A2G6JPA3_NEPCE|nr:MAG: protease HtpX [Neptuniibacter caesariensis]